MSADDFLKLRPQGGFNVILADPPWQFENWSEKGDAKNPNQHYDCISTEQICKIPVGLLASNNCVLFMWGTWPMMPDWMKVINGWNFNYSGLGWEWLKYNPETGKYHFGPGYGTRKNVEPCLMATRGSPKRNDTKAARSVRDFILAPRRLHSQKPEQQYENIETMFPGPYIELFSRKSRPGWTAWGNEVGKHD